MPASFPAIVTVTVGVLATASAGFAVDLSLSVDGMPAEYLEDDYTCADGRAFTVTYVNADPVFLAILPTTDDQELVFVRSLSGSGSRYVANGFEWWIKGGEATLTNRMGDPDKPGIVCTTP